ncbi:MAG: hypothetical protein HN576_13870 [Bacteriovoracaceae bacterium]|jgi:biopolymer transport protein ExbD|nr:hypothetical protein [Bacteriovoracaceae bacterium]
MNNIHKRKKYIKRLNLIPILDAVFIFIFFLLMSAQFVDIHEIGSDAPAISLIESIKEKRPPLNLVLDINSKSIVIKTGVNGHIYKTIPNISNRYDLKSLSKELRSIKSKNMEEDSIILRPKSKISYEKIVNIMDSVRSIEPGIQIIRGKDKFGKFIKTDKLFKQIIFETII